MSCNEFRINGVAFSKKYLQRNFLKFTFTPPHTQPNTNSQKLDKFSPQFLSTFFVLYLCNNPTKYFYMGLSPSQIINTVSFFSSHRDMDRKKRERRG